MIAIKFNVRSYGRRQARDLASAVAEAKDKTKDLVAEALSRRLGR